MSEEPIVILITHSPLSGERGGAGSSALADGRHGVAAPGGLAQGSSTGHVIPRIAGICIRRTGGSVLAEALAAADAARQPRLPHRRSIAQGSLRTHHASGRQDDARCCSKRDAGAGFRASVFACLASNGGSPGERRQTGISVQCSMSFNLKLHQSMPGSGLPRSASMSHATSPVSSAMSAAQVKRNDESSVQWPVSLKWR